jgi:DNA-binding response OmpR family regulator
MDDIDTTYREISSELDIPLERVHTLKPAALRVLKYLSDNRDRIVAQPEIALHVFGESSDQARRQVKTHTFAIRLLLRKCARLKPTFTRYRGRLSTGLRWESIDNPDEPAAEAATREQNAS